MLNGHDGCMFYDDLAIDVASISHLLKPHVKSKLQLTEPDLFFTFTIFYNRKQKGVIGGKEVAGRQASKFISTKTAKQQSWSRTNFFYKSFSLITSGIFRYQFFVPVSGNLGEESPNKWQCIVVPRTRIISYCITRQKLHKFLKSNEPKLLHWLETDISGLKLKLNKGRGYKKSKTKENRKLKSNQRKNNRA